MRIPKLIPKPISGFTYPSKKVAQGSATVTVTARDGDGNQVSDRFEVSTRNKCAGLVAR